MVQVKTIPFLSESSENLLLLKGKVLPAARSYDLMGHLDGTSKPPARYSSDKGDTSEETPEFQRWYKRDQFVMAWINSTLTPAVLAQVLDMTSAHEVWTALTTSYAKVFEASLMHLRNELQTCKRGTDS